MILPYQVIRDRLHDPTDDLEIEPINESQQLQPASVDLRLGTEIITFRRLNDEAIDPRSNPEDYGQRREVNDSFIIQSGEFLLAETAEWMSIPDDLVAFVHGRSSWARLAIQPHAAGLLDSGWDGYTTLEVFNMGPMPVHLIPGMRFCQVTFERLTEATDMSYDGKYQEQSGVEMSRISEDGEM